MLPPYGPFYQQRSTTIEEEPDLSKPANLPLSEYEPLLMTLQEAEDMNIQWLITTYELEASNTEDTSEILCRLITTEVDNLNNEDFENLWINIKTPISQQLQHEADKGK